MPESANNRETAVETQPVLNTPTFTTTDLITVPGVPFQPNEQQQSLLRWARDLAGSLNLIARAGCGKSTALMLLVRFIVSIFHPMKQYPRIFMGAFNKAISEELAAKMGTIPGVEVGTMHSLGLRLCKLIIETRVDLDSKKVKNLAHKLCPWDRKYKQVLVDLVGYAKQAGFGVKSCPQLKDKAAWTQLADHYDIWDDVPAGISPERLFNDAYKLYNQSLNLCLTEGRIDFDDMILLPVYYADKVGKPEMFDWVLIDEAQDTNQVRRLLTQLVLKTGGRMVAVGDDRQAIYGFAGASHDSLDQIKRAMNSQELPLSITYRCPKLVVAHAQEYVQDIQAHESAPEGVVRTIHHSKLWNQEFTPKDVILCRNTYPLIGIAQRLRTQGIPCIVEGNNGQAIISLATKWGDVTVGVMLGNLDDYLKEQVAKWTAKDRLDRVEAAQDKVATVRDLAAGLSGEDPIRRLVQRIESLFGQGEGDEDVLHLCTIHRSKGREWDRVFLVGANVYQPSKWAKKEWEIKQEDNLMYVAITRSKRELVYVDAVLTRSDEPHWWEVGYVPTPEDEEELNYENYGGDEDLGGEGDPK